MGAFDGDQRGRIPADIANVSLCLPGEKPLELIFKEVVTSAPEKAADVLGLKNLRPVLAGLEGANIHDWYEEISRAAGLSRQQLFPFLLKLWLESDDNQEAFADAYRAIVALVGIAIDQS
jgi:hypothetical protein